MRITGTLAPSAISELKWASPLLLFRRVSATDATESSKCLDKPSTSRRASLLMRNKGVADDCAATMLDVGAGLRCGWPGRAGTSEDLHEASLVFAGLGGWGARLELSSGVSWATISVLPLYSGIFFVANCGS
ncbi:hypothetical protein EJ04DRAFT_219517 [Polyplosphaeria fusca]|uniref:Uncharacterized protein n=1 Tax=Polyplosphaeria fusca TaxID=682080 RepID=A0A9P4V4E0_9PLEO|nr:hypothetical protein EJ04DRAFT_219517 [Polyplosphaeria fusca]